MTKAITFKGKEYPIRLSYLVIKMISTDGGRDLTKVDTENFAPAEMEKMLFWGLKSGANAMNTTFDFTMEQMVDVLDECFLDFVALIPMFFKKVDVGGEAAMKDSWEEIIKTKIDFTEDQQKIVKESLKRVFERGYGEGKTEEQLKKVTPQSNPSQ